MKVVVGTNGRLLLCQWYACLENAFDMSMGVWYAQEKKLEPITVTTYPSAYAHAETLGDRLKLLIFDAIHHLPVPSWHEIALMCAAPYRLGLIATYPEKVERWSTLPPSLTNSWVRRSTKNTLRYMQLGITDRIQRPQNVEALSPRRSLDE